MSKITCVTRPVFLLYNSAFAHCYSPGTRALTISLLLKPPIFRHPKGIQLLASRGIRTRVELQLRRALFVKYPLTHPTGCSYSDRVRN